LAADSAFHVYWMLVTLKLVGGASWAEAGAALNAIANACIVDELFA
jgi:hypothetical protein